ncbi:hypothetical protein H9W95_05385 [Flavobacterium lindanitolerans]|nr:hypothetical protein [Flavobacterium lindanitolerans]
MNVSPMKVNWRFNVMDVSDGFNIKGSIFQFPANRLKPFTKPYMNASVEGMLNEVYFNFSGNDVKSKGDFAIKYDDIKVTLYQKKNPKKKNKFLSAVGNLFVKTILMKRLWKQKSKLRESRKNHSIISFGGI